MSSQWYKAAPFYLLRVPVLPATLLATLSQCGRVDLSPGQDLEQAYQRARQASLRWLAQLASHPLIEQALMVASPSLAEALDKQKKANDHRSERAYERLLRYVIRMSHRPTPFGCCAGVAFGRFAVQSRVQLEQFEPVGVRPDMHWLWTWLSEIEARFLPLLEVEVVPALFVFGNRGMSIRQGKNGEPDERLWFHMTPVFHRLRERARLPVPSAALKRALLADFPQASGEQIDAFLSELSRLGVLLTSLLPADEHDPLSHVIDLLRPFPEAAAEIGQLETVQTAIHAISQNIRVLPTVIHQLHALTSQFDGIPVQVDTRARMKQNELSSKIGLEAAKVAEVLLRLGMYPQGLPSLHRARRLFQERYEEQEVPLLPLFAPQGALEHLYDQEKEPGDLRDLPREQQSRLTRRTRLLHTLAMQAVHDRKHAIELTPDLLERLSLWSLSEGLPPPLLDLYMQIDAASLEAIDRGDWRGLVTLLPAGGRSYRRFLSLFGEHEQEMVRDVLRAEDECCPGSLCATLAVLPEQVRDLNVMHGPLWSAYVLPINRLSPATPERTILPDDLLVSLRAGRFLLRSLTHNKAVRVIQPHMLSFLHLPALARFLLEASHDGEPFPGPFQWGQAGTLPFLPQLTWGKIILSLARWRLSHDLLESRGVEGGERIQWFRAIQRWREHWRVPRYVSLIDGENQLPLDLEHPLMADMLRQELARTKKALILQETFFHENEGWLHDAEGNRYVSEVVIPLIRTTAAPQPPPLRGTPQIITEQERRFLPGQEWLSLKVYLPEGLHSLLLTRAWSPFLRRFRSLCEGWFFVRYQDPQDHLRLRLLARHEQQRQHLLEAVLAWCQQIQQEGFPALCVLDTYEREIERYGGPETIATIERVFCANSEAVCALLAGPQGTHLPLFAAVYALDRLWSDWGYDLAERRRALQRFLPPGKESQALRKQRQSLLAFLKHPPEYLSSLFDSQGVVLAQAGSTIRQLAEQKILWRTEEEILWSLSHMLCNRLLGTNRKDEQEVYAAWHVTLKVRSHMDHG